VVLDQNTLGSDIPSVAADLTRANGGAPKDIYRHAIKGFSIHVVEAVAIAISRDSRVDYVEEDGKVSLATTQTITYPDGPWGLDRSDQRSLPLDSAYTYNSNGTGVNVYVIDTGIWLSHQEFGGRALAGYDYFRNPADCLYGWDCAGHGSHVAGIIDGSTYGVAKNATLYSVRVFDCSPASTTSIIAAGIDWVTANHINPAVANMSVGASPSDVLDTATRKAIASGLTCVIAAGNGIDNRGNPVDASNVSPARVEEAITVGATDKTDYRSYFSNFGPLVDVFAPGDSIPSVAIGTFNGCQAIGNTNWRLDVGTSMAAPHVAGAIARYLQTNPSASPSTVQQWIVNNATTGSLRDRGASFSQDVPYDGSLSDYSLSLYGDGYVNVPSSSSLNLTRPFTVEAWVETKDNGPVQQGVAERYNSVPGVVDGGFALRLVGGKIQFWSLKNGWDLAGQPVTGVTAIANQAWHHVAGVFDGNQLRVYLDGMLDGSTPSMNAPAPGTASLKIGARGDDAAFRFNGLIDEVRVTAGVVYTSNFIPRSHLRAISGTIGSWGFDSQTANDGSGFGNNGTLTGCASYLLDTPSGIPATTNYSLALTGDPERPSNPPTAYIDVLSNTSLNLTGLFTVEAWIKTKSLTAPQQGIAERYKAIPGVIDGGFALRLIGGKVQFWSLKNGWDLADSVTGNAVIDCRWHHVAGVFDGGYLRIYIDGVQDAFKPSTYAPAGGTASLKIGARGDDAAYLFNGWIDEVRVTSSAVYQNGTSFTPQQHLTALAGTIGLWKFDNQTANDTSGYGNNGLSFTGNATQNRMLYISPQQ